MSTKVITNLHEEAKLKRYPIAECFTSPQGEGCFAGQSQFFIRLAGCTVGKPYPKDHPIRHGLTLPIYTEECTLYDGRRFSCDTDYRKHSQFTAHELMEKIPAGVDDVCITGGEPLMHDLSTLITYIFGVGRKIHIETSGTIYADLKPDIWVTVSPKRGIMEMMINRADELKILVDENFNPEEPLETARKEFYLPTLAYKKPVFLQPVNGEKSVSAKNLDLCRQWQIKFPSFRLSIQMHKVMSLILGEEIR
jgi:7-carboxy-7-deazaguanine synthase